MKTEINISRRRRRTKPLIGFLIVFSAALILHPSSFAETHQAWIAKYNNGIATGTHQPVAMALDPLGNIVVTGFSQNAASNLDYVTLKYAPTGTLIWVSRFSTNANAQPRGLAIDADGNAILTGTATTLKYNTNGQQVWTAPYPGRALVVDTNRDIYVTGFLDNIFSTVKLSSSGSNQWIKTYYYLTNWIDCSQIIALDATGRIYVAGRTVWNVYRGGYNSGITLVIYNGNGNQLFSSGSYGLGSDEVKALSVDPLGNSYAAYNDIQYPFEVALFDSTAMRVWNTPPLAGNYSAQVAQALGNSGIYLAGTQLTNFGDAYVMETVKLATNSTRIWTRYYGDSLSGNGGANSIALDTNENVFVTGFNATTTGTDLITIKYDKEGNQQWVQTYDGLAHGDDRGVAIAVSKIGDIYVAGYETVPGGGTQIVLIKYSNQKIERHADGTIHLEYPGITGQSYAFLATCDFNAWDNLGSSIADTNNIATFDDTNAPLYPSRFYRIFGP